MDERTIDDEVAQALAERLIRATATRTAVAPLTAERPRLTAADGYAIQRRVVSYRTAAGEVIVGWKLGLTSKAMQTQLGVGSPDYGPILSGSRVSPGGMLRAAEFIAPRVEAEIAVVLGQPLSGAVTRDMVLEATIGVCAAIEVIDSRITDWQITLADTIADLASSAKVVLSDVVIPIDGFEPRLIGCLFERDGEVLATGAGGAALGDPLAAVAWASETLGQLGLTMEAGAVIMTGALHASVPARAGDTFTARFDRLGDLSVRFA
ncbi:MAG: 2-keto-4-pentenoate hydratase [Candidatus Limnocylindrales bacterium]